MLLVHTNFPNLTAQCLLTPVSYAYISSSYCLALLLLYRKYHVILWKYWLISFFMYVHLVDLKESTISMNDFDATILSSNFWPPIQVRKYFRVKMWWYLCRTFTLRCPILNDDALVVLALKDPLEWNISYICVYRPSLYFGMLVSWFSLGIEGLYAEVNYSGGEKELFICQHLFLEVDFRCFNFFGEPSNHGEF